MSTYRERVEAHQFQSWWLGPADAKKAVWQVVSMESTDDACRQGFEAALRIGSAIATEADATEAQLRAALSDKDEVIGALVAQLHADRHNLQSWHASVAGHLQDRGGLESDLQDIDAALALAQQHREPSK